MFFFLFFTILWALSYIIILRNIERNVNLHNVCIYRRICQCCLVAVDVFLLVVGARIVCNSQVALIEQYLFFLYCFVRFNRVKSWVEF